LKFSVVISQWSTKVTELTLSYTTLTPSVL